MFRPASTRIGGGLWLVNFTIIFDCNHEQYISYDRLDVCRICLGSTTLKDVEKFSKETTGTLRLVMPTNCLF